LSPSSDAPIRSTGGAAMRGLTALSLLAIGTAFALTWLRAEAPPAPVPAPAAQTPTPQAVLVPPAPAPPPAAPSAAPAARELLRYRAPDGHVGMTDDPARVPPGATILARETVREPAPAAEAPARERVLAAARVPRTPAASDDAAAEDFWRERARRVLADLSRARDATAVAERVARGACRRYRDHFGSLRSSGDCAYEREQLRLARERQAAVRTYLLEDLGEECRRGGCLPGWIRAAEDGAGPDPLADADRDGYDADGDGFDHDPDVESSDG